MRSAVHTVLCWLGFAIPLLFCACHGQQRQQMLALLDEADSLNRAYAQLPSDTLLLEAADFFDRHGSSNERLRAHYLLGCAYRDMGDAPRAIDCYLDAAACADTTAEDCDFRRLGCVYSQMADTYYYQMLFSNSIEASRKAQYYAELAGDTLWAISDLKLQASIYILQNKTDSAEIILRKTIALYNKHGYIQDGILTSTMLMHLFVGQPTKQAELKELIEKFDSDCELFDENHELPPSNRQFYYYKGKYFETISQLDSAEHYYRKIYRPNMSFVSTDPLYKGLLGVFQKKHLSDSIAKYAQLYCMVNDSSIAVRDQALTAQLSASYNYSKYQKQAVENAKKTHRHQKLISILVSIIFAGIIATFFLWHLHMVSLNKRILALNLLKAELINVTRKYEEKQRQFQLLNQEIEQVTRDKSEKERQLQQLQQSHELSISTVKEELVKTREKNKEAQHIIEQLTVQFEEEKEKLKHEIADYNSKLEELEKHFCSSSKQKYKQFKSLGLIKRVDIFARNGKKQLSESDKNMLIELASEYFPDVFNDLNGHQNIGRLANLVCILVILNIKPNAIHNLLGISLSHVSNLRKAINFALFKDETALTLKSNLLAHYKLY